ncbi:MAG: hypothetical protein ACOYXT_15760 [Bacteroidota bacterium]
MKNLLLPFLSSCVMIVMVGALSSCKDDPPPAKPKLSFAESEMTINEADGTIEIEVVLDKPASEDITVEYEVEGTAIDKETAGTSSPYDYEILSDFGEIEIDKGQTTGIIEIEPFSDRDPEDDEVIEFKITDVDSDNIELTNDDEITITLKQEDGLLVALEWGVGAGEVYDDVDMDLFLWQESLSTTQPTNYYGVFGSNITSLIGSTDSPELFFMPTALFSDGNYGLSCAYYAGTEDPMNFQVTFVSLTGGVEGTPVVKKATYGLVNINKWDDPNTGTDLIKVLSFKKVGTTFSDFSNITVPVSGSRIQTVAPPKDAKRNSGTAVIPPRFKNILQK